MHPPALSIVRRAFLLFVTLLVLAAGAAHAKPPRMLPGDTRTVSEAEVAAAIRASPNANQWLRDNAEAVAHLAYFESGLRPGIYNGSCCYGILQMNTSNIRRYAGVEPSVYRTWSLQDQVNAWSELTVNAMNAGSVRQLQRMQASGTTFDGRQVDFNMVMACIQLGVGNCQTMLNSGRCSGFADINGTTICGMADRMAGGGSSSGAGGGTGAFGGGGSTRPVVAFQCRRNADGSCMTTSEAMRAAFREGSGVDMDTLRQLIQILLLASALLVMGNATLTAWNCYTKGVIEQHHMLFYMKRALMVVGTVVVIVTFM